MAKLKPESINAFDQYDKVVSFDDAVRYTKDIAAIATDPLKAEIKGLRQELAAARQAGTSVAPSSVTSNIKGKIMNINNADLQNAVGSVTQETISSAKLMGGKALLKVITKVAEKLVFSRMGFFARAFTTVEQKQFYVNVATYFLVHAIKSGGFGLTKYRISHPALDYVTLAANSAIIEYAAETVFGGNFELVNELFSTPVAVASAN